MTKFQEVIEAILKRRGFFEAFKASDEFHLRLQMKSYMPLVIERIGNMISVAHYYEQNGDLIADPDVELNFATWEPTAIQQVFGYTRVTDERTRRDIASFLDLWAFNIQEQGWAEKGEVVD